MGINKIKVVWICSFSNPKVRERLPVKVNFLRRTIYRLKGRSFREGSDMAIWNTNGIEEMENMEDVELYVICPIRDLSKREVRYTEKNIHYCFFREQDSGLFQFLIHQIFFKHSYKFKKNRKYIKRIIDEVKPDIVHVMGAENPFYSLALLDIPRTIPTIIQLQTLLIKFVNVTKDKNQKIDFYYKGQIEKELINNATYVGATVKEFKDYILNNINPDARILDITLAMGNKINLDKCHKDFDFVYFANDISKAGLEAIESFVLARKQKPGITMDIVGSYSEDFKKKLDDKLLEYHANNAVTFEGRLPSHDDVIKQIRKSRFALIPLKIDIVPNTLREAMANGLPVVTTITDGTPSLNEKRESVLLSAQGDFQAMADNMLRLMDDDELQNRLRNNAAITDGEYLSNRIVIEDYCKAYRACIDNHLNNIPLPEGLL